MRRLLAAAALAATLGSMPPASAEAPVEQTSLLNRGKKRTSVRVRAHGPLNDAAKKGVNPRPEGHMLTDTELQNVTSIACLEARQTNPGVNCSEAFTAGSPLTGPLNAGNYPTWKDPRCRSDGEFFCDPDRLLSEEDRKSLTQQLGRLRHQHRITCRNPHPGQNPPVDVWHYEPFYLGVAIAKDWPLHESDSESLQNAGRVIAGRWNMSWAWDGDPAFYGRWCSNEGMLIILPDKRQAALSTASCAFVCSERGGPEVVTATLLGLDTSGEKGLYAGVSAGIDEVYKVLQHTSPMLDGAAGSPASQPWKATNTTWQQGLFDWVQRIIFGFSVVALGLALGIAVLVCILAPGAMKELNKSVV